MNKYGLEDYFNELDIIFNKFYMEQDFYKALDHLDEAFRLLAPHRGQKGCKWIDRLCDNISALKTDIKSSHYKYTGIPL